MQGFFQLIKNDRKILPYSLSMFVYFCAIITTFWILKPLKKTVFIGHYDKLGLNLGEWSFLGSSWNLNFTAAQTEQMAKIINLLLAIVAFLFFAKLSKYLHKEKLTYLFTSMCIGLFAYFAFVFNQSTVVSTVNVWLFYLFGDFYNTLMVTTFFAFLNDSVTPKLSRQLFGPIILGGVVGGVIGTTWVKIFIKTIPLAQWMWIGIGISFVMICAAFIASRSPLTAGESKESQEEEQGKPTLTSIFAVVKNRYVWLIAAILGSYEMVSVLMDYKFTAVVSHYLDGPELGEHFSTVYAAVTWLSLFVQIFVTGFMLRLAGVQKTLFVLPTVLLVTVFGFIAFPILWIASLMPIFDNGLNYSIHQSAREALYVPLSKSTKYKAKAFIDIFVMRAAKVLSIFLSLGIGLLFTEFESLKWLAVLTAGLIVFLMTCIWKVGVHYRSLTSKVLNSQEEAPKFANHANREKVLT